MTTGKVDIERIIKEHAETMSARMLEIAQVARSEEDVRHETNKLIDEFLKKAEIDITGRHEYGLAGGRIDSKYGGVIIEYKDPRGSGKITEDPNAPGTKAVIEQIKKRFKDFQFQTHVKEPERIFGVGCDGDTFVFVRYRSKQFEVENPQPVTPHSVERLLRALVSLGAHGLSFTPDQLTLSFGADSLVAQKGIRDIYGVICETEDPKAKTFFQQWKILFGEVCGYDVEGRSEKIKKLGEHYLVPGAKPAELLFSVHTYYAIFIKFLAAEIASSFSPLGASVIKRCIEAPTDSALRREMENLEQGGIWSQLGITNFLEGDLFSWYLAAWDEHMAEVVRGIVGTLDKYDPTTLSVEPAESRDLLKKLYQHLFPKSVRHDLGEYYTPDWLAEHVLNELEYEGDPDKRLLDPACGSGTFLVMAINRIKKWFEEHRHECSYDETELVKKILSNIIGFDLNPLAVMASRTNYLIAIRDLLRYASGVELPVYLCDSVMTPAEYGDLFTGGTGKAKKLKTAAGEFLIPSEIATSREQMGKYAETIEFCVRNNYSADDFISRCREENLPISDDNLHSELYKRLGKLDAENQNGVWARIIKNAFAPLFIESVDYIAGNPPWVNWENLPKDYRKVTSKIWEAYQLQARSGGEQFELGKQKRDFSILFVYSCLDNYVEYDGKLGFIITQTVFKSRGAEVFRNFKITSRNYIECLRVDDLSSFQPFEGASNRTAVLICRKSEKPLSYPVSYFVWQKQPKKKINLDKELSDILQCILMKKFAAVPLDVKNRSSPWLTAPAVIISTAQNIIGSSNYKAQAGCCTWLNGVYWIRVLDKLPDGNLLIENLYNVGRIKIERVQMSIEPDLVYPLLRGRDIRRWKAESSANIVYPHTSELGWIPIDKIIMKRRHPKTYSYLLRFRDKLLKRSGYKQLRKGHEFYILGNTNAANLCRWKVVWPWISKGLRCAVVGGRKNHNEIPEHNTSFVALENEMEAHYLCGVLNSSLSDFLARSIYAGGGGGIASPQILNYIAIPRFNQKDLNHIALAELSKSCHSFSTEGNVENVREIEIEIDRLVSKLWDIKDSEFNTIRETLANM